MEKKLGAVLLFVFLMTSCLAMANPASYASTVENSVVSKTPLFQARSDLGVAAANGKLYAIGGTTEIQYNNDFSGGIVGTNAVYDPATDTWAHTHDMPTPRRGFAIASYKNRIYCIGGYTSLGASGANEVYHPSKDAWETKAPIPAGLENLEWLQANLVDGKIYLIGAQYGSEYAGANNLSSPFRMLTQVYDPATNSWTSKAAMPIADVPYVSSSIDNAIYVIGEKSIQIYDAETDNWLQGSAPPFNNRQATAVATTGLVAPKRIYTFGAKYNSTGDFVGNEIHAYDPEKGSWTTPVLLTSERHDFGVAVVNDLVYVVGGDYTYSYQTMQTTTTYHVLRDTVEQYTPFGYGTVPPTNAPQTFPTVPVVAASVASVVIVCIGVFYYFKKRKH